MYMYTYTPFMPRIWGERARPGHAAHGPADAQRRRASASKTRISCTGLLSFIQPTFHNFT